MRRPRGRPSGKVPRYLSIADRMKQSLLSGEWPTNKPIPSCRSLAQLYGVSPRTAWMAVKALQIDGHVRTSPRRVSVATRPVPIASVMKGAVVIISKIALSDLFGSDQDADLTDIGQGIIQELSIRRTALLALQEIRWWRRQCPHGLRDVDIKGIVVTALLPKPLLKEYASMGVRVVVVDQPAGIPEICSVTTANREAASESTARLLSMGCRKLAYVRPVVHSIRDIDPDAKERQEGFIDVCKKARLPESDYTIFTAAYNEHSAGIVKMIRTQPRYTGILTSSELHALQIINIAKAEGLTIPADLSLVTFHNRNKNPHNWSGPGIDFKEMGRIAVRLLDGRSAVQHLRVNAEWNEGTTLRMAPSSIARSKSALKRI